jgi:hypothetical protein
VVTSFYQNSANYVSFPFCETYSTLSLTTTPYFIGISSTRWPFCSTLSAAFTVFSSKKILPVFQFILYHFAVCSHIVCYGGLQIRLGALAVG